MNATVAELKSIVEIFAVKISTLSHGDFSHKSSAKKWSPKEVLGHLIDSAENNLRRFIVAQYEVPAPKITYQQDFWVTANQYQDLPAKDVIENWRLINLKICRVLAQMPRENYLKTCDFGDGKSLSLEWLAIDYLKHLKHHLNQIIPSSFDITYP